VVPCAVQLLLRPSARWKCMVAVSLACSKLARLVECKRSPPLTEPLQPGHSHSCLGLPATPRRWTTLC
jgi:hypothetical protein